MPRSLQRREAGLEVVPGRVARARVFVALVAARRFVHKGGREVDRDDDGTRRRIGALSDVHGTGPQAESLLELHADQLRPRRATNSSRSLRVITPTGRSPSMIMSAGSPPSRASNASSMGAPAATRAKGGSM